MKKLFLILLFMGLSVHFAAAQKNKGYQPDESKMTPEQRMVHQNAKYKDGGRNADVSKKVKRANKVDKKARKKKAPKPPKRPKPKN